MVVVRVVRDQRVFSVGEYREIVLDRLLLQVGDHLGRDPFLEEQFARLHVDDLPAIVGEDKSAVVIQFEGMGQREETRGRPSRGEHDMNPHLLRFE